MDSRVIGVRKAAELLYVSGDTIRRWADNGLLPSYRLPSGHRRFESTRVLEFREKLLKPAESGERP